MLNYLLRLCQEAEPTFAGLRNAVEPLTVYAVAARYPGSGADPNSEEAEEALSTAREAWEFVLAQLPPETHPNAEWAS